VISTGATEIQRNESFDGDLNIVKRDNAYARRRILTTGINADGIASKTWF